MMPDLVGTSLGPYVITERIGRGGMADVYKAFHASLSVYRAVKVIRSEFVGSDDFRARFQKEARAVAQLRHPNIVQVHDFGMHGDAYYMVMEFIEGRDLKKVLVAEGSIQPISRAVELVMQVAAALQYAHDRGLIHRDVKPENVMVTGGGVPILTDFGIAKLATAGTQLTQTGMGIGTPAYMSPEQAQGGSDVGPEADVYALSVVLFELLTGRVPFSADTPVAVVLKAIKDPLPMPRALNPQISEALQAVIIKGTAKLPADRFATVAELRTALERAMNATPPNEAGASPTSTLGDPTRARIVVAPRVSRGRARLLASIAIGSLLAAAGYLWMTRQGTPQTDVAASVAPPSPAPGAGGAMNASPVTTAVVDGGTLSFDHAITGKTGHAGQRVEYGFDAVAGDSVYFDHHRATAETRFALFAPDGARVFETTSDDGPRTLAQQGRYRLSVEPRSSGPAEFEFSLWHLMPAVLNGGTIRPNVLVEGRTELPGQREDFAIEGKAGEQLTFVLNQASEATDFTLVDSNGREILHTGRDTGPVTLPHTSPYTLIADPRFDKPGRYEFMLRSVVQRPSRADRMAQSPATVGKPEATIGASQVEVDRAEPVAKRDPIVRVPEQNALTGAPVVAGGGSLNQVTKGVTTQADLLKLFGGPNLTTVDPQGRDTWVYERSVTQSSSRSATTAGSGSVDFSAFWSVGQAGASASKAESTSTLSNSTSIHTVTVIVTFAPNRTVLDYTVTENYF